MNESTPGFWQTMIFMHVFLTATVGRFDSGLKMALKRMWVLLTGWKVYAGYRKGRGWNVRPVKGGKI